MLYTCMVLIIRLHDNLFIFSSAFSQERKSEFCIYISEVLTFIVEFFVCFYNNGILGLFYYIKMNPTRIEGVTLLVWF